MDEPFSHSGSTSEHLAPQLETSTNLTAYKVSVQEECLKCPPAEAFPDLRNVYAGQLAQMPSRQHAEVCVHREQPCLKEVLHHAYALHSMLCIPSQHHATGLQTDCMVIVPGPMVRLPDSQVYALWP